MLRRRDPPDAHPLSAYHSGGHAYLCAVMDCHSRNVLGWAASNAMEPGLCLEALDNALPATGSVPEVFIADPGCKFTSALAL